MGAKAAARIFGILAPEANQVVILRRGPTDYCLMLVWDLKTDSITPGQWVKGCVYVERCDVSPNGKYFVGVISNYQRAHRKWEEVGDFLALWTAISRPPYFTALDIWFMHYNSGGGGIWTTNQDALLFDSYFDDPQKDQETVKPRRPKGIIIRKMGAFPHILGEPIERLFHKRGWKQLAILSYKDDKRSYMALSHQDESRERSAILAGIPKEYLAVKMQAKELLDLYKWRRVASLGIWEKRFPSGQFRRTSHYFYEVWQILDQSGLVKKEWYIGPSESKWLEVDADGAPIFSENGCLYRWRSFPDGEPQMVADLNPYTFTPVAAPDWAKEW